MKRVVISALSIFLATGLSACGDGGNSNDIVGKTLQNLANESLPGADITRRECGSCHYLDKNVRKVGPSLQGIYGQTPKTKGIPVEVWDEASLDAWIENPTGVDPKTRMKIPGIKDAEKRAQIIEYLKLL
ncbi:c-type cytochrome [Mariprofundus sp. KV]|uniref:c-type cytochrome n=1 Tax=Mariprofundus sp. KV TaxID=2608715 RepID=UPI0015A37FEE|nr:c-type cytochrome [Mariprofundus sp. KV]NWF36510.1 hypothetical protein [Mariprofundus sp. KV]